MGANVMEAAAETVGRNGWLASEQHGEIEDTTQQRLVCSHTEWDPLEEVIVGRVDHACVPTWHPVLAATMPPKHWRFFQTQGGRYFPEEILRAAADELDHLSALLAAEGVTVKRPDIANWDTPFSTPDFDQPTGLYSAMPRDLLLVIGEEIIEAPMAWRSRYFESRAYRAGCSMHDDLARTSELVLAQQVTKPR